jgi:hypothetical protein
VTAYLEAHRAEVELVPLEGDRVTIGNDPTNQLRFDSDATVSRTHAVLERIGGAWRIRDLGSRNGTFVNGERCVAERALRNGDEIRLGRSRLIFRAPAAEPVASVTEAVDPPPELTRRERDVLVALCGPLLGGNLFTEPAAVRDIADDLVVTETAVRQHLVRLYEKFGIPDGGDRRRVLLANEAIGRGAVSIADLRQ